MNFWCGITPMQYEYQMLFFYNSDNILEQWVLIILKIFAYDLLIENYNSDILRFKFGGILSISWFIFPRLYQKWAKI